MILVSLDDGAPIVLNKAVIFFGRSHECDVILTHSRKVSRKHCCVAQIDDSYVVRDLGSMNGVRVNDRKADPELPLNVGDELWVGDVGYRFQPNATNGKAVQSPVEIKDDPKARFVMPLYESMDHPVAIPEEGEDFIIEESIRQKKIDPDEKGTFD